MPLLAVNLGKRSEESFKRALGHLKDFGFRYQKQQRVWVRLVENDHAGSIQKHLKDLGIRAEIKDPS